jgi:cytochrome c5
LNNRLVLWISMLGLLTLMLVPASCSSYVAPTSIIIPTPHGTNLGFANCLVCHTGGEYPIPSDAIHFNADIGTCTLLSCHPVKGAEPVVITTTTTPTPTVTVTTATTAPPTATTTTAPPTLTTTTTVPPTTTTQAVPATLSPEYHKMYKDASVCFACHTGLQPVVPNPADHADYAPTSCLDPGCHVLPK